LGYPLVMSIVVERESKYDVPVGFHLPDLCGAGAVARVGPPAVHELDAIYLDTVDLRLARHHVTLRRRTGGSDAGWHVKVPGATGSRTEYRAPLGARQLPDELDLQVRALRRGAPLHPVARIHTTRREYPLLDAGGRVLAMLARDEVRAEVAKADPREWQELEVELVEGDPRVLSEVDEVLRRAGARPSAAASKLARALGDRLCDPPTPQDPTLAAVLEYGRAQRDALLAKDPAVRRDESEAVHDMRVAVRRLRSTLRTFRPLWNPQRASKLRDELKWLADQLGPVRDGEVMRERLLAAVRAEPEHLVVGPIADRIREWLDADLAQGRQRLLAALDSTRYLALLDALDELLDAAPPDTAPRTLLARARKALRRADRDLDAAQTDPQLHEARKEFKRARYAAEALTPVGGKPAKRLAKRLADLQDVLGTHQDAAVTQALLLDLDDRARARGENGFTLGLLHARQREAGQRVLRDLPAAVRRARRGKYRRWLRAA
jgi:CHAD domain-containing protein